ncbi:pantoate--beta-alanine ligase [Microbacterium invictum]|uniref:Pantothenate synthetase n=1 Tax=Microbacterium invictum TaxID=515415 RepID=A0AA40VNS3_9MICO|nr:pantoate--beta-alanine ligase [Microbacterium invictum]MBB4141124.1 pantoate--beta-alanine ligase [Microbacterium invictum]
MKVIRTIPELRAFVADSRARSRRVGFVPTMGALHEGHLSLIRSASGACDDVIVSVFVNPTQFNDAGDLQAYPRDEEHDIRLASDAGADVAFVPDRAEMYPPGFATSIHVGGVSERWEGESRGASHFDGVAVVVSKLLLMVMPDAAWFGQKDAQQVAVVRRLVSDLNVDSEIFAGPTVRDSDGLALSSRNTRLSAEERVTALGISRSLRSVVARADDGEVDAGVLADHGRAIAQDAGVDVEYWAIVDPATFEPVERVGEKVALAIVAGRVGSVRLIDNMTIPAVGAAGRE